MALTKVDNRLIVGVPNVSPEIVDLRSADPSDYPAAILTAQDKEGLFIGSSSDESSSLVLASISSTSISSSTITVSGGHGLVTGEVVTPTASVNGLTAGTLYYVARISDTQFRLATTWSNARQASANVSNYATYITLSGSTAMTFKHIADPLEGVYVPLGGDPTGASGAYSRKLEDVILPEWFGVDGSGDDQEYLQQAIDFAARDRKKLYISSPLTVGAGVNAGPAGIGYGAIATLDDLVMEWANGAVTSVQGFSIYGSSIENARDRGASASAETVQNKITLINPQLDGASYPAISEFTLAVAGTTTTCTLPASASSIDDYYVGLAIEHSAGSGSLKFVSAYNGTTKVVTTTGTWTPPSIGDHVFIGWNDNAIGLGIGVSHVTVDGGVVTNFNQDTMVPVATGGKGINLEQGVQVGRVNGLSAENMSTGFFVQTGTGTLGNGQLAQTRSIQYSNISAKNCGSALTLDGNLNDAGSPNAYDNSVIVDGLQYENCGYFPYRFVGAASSQQKCGAINFGQVNNIIISNVIGINSSAYDTQGFPTDYPARCGYGPSLIQGTTNAVGAVLWGWGTNIQISNVMHYGNVDHVVKCCRTRALGNDALPTTAGNCHGWQLDNIKLEGNCKTLVAIDDHAGGRVSPLDWSGEIEIAINGTVSTSLVDANMSNFDDLLLRLTNVSDGTVVIGTPRQIISSGNSFSHYKTGATTDLRRIRLAVLNNGFVTITPPSEFGIMTITSPHLNPGGGTGGAALRAVISFSCDSSTPACVNIGTAIANVNTTTGVLTGTTGAVGAFTISAHTDGLLYLENRTGVVAANVYINFISG